mgnify:CR=1 FL=1
MEKQWMMLVGWLVDCALLVYGNGNGNVEVMMMMMIIVTIDNVYQK